MKQPLSNQQKQVKTPNASISEALNLSRNAQETFRPVFQAIKDKESPTSNFWLMKQLQHIRLKENC